MSLSALFKKTSDSTLQDQVDQACAAINSAIGDDLDILTQRLTAPQSRRAREKTAGDYNETTGLLRYKVREFQSVHSESYDTRTADSERIKKILADSVSNNHAYALLHARCADPAVDIRVEYTIEKDFEANYPNISYNRITGYIELHVREPYKNSTRKLQPAPAAPPPPPKPDIKDIVRDYLDTLDPQERAALVGVELPAAEPEPRVLRPVRVKIDKRQG